MYEYVVFESLCVCVCVYESLAEADDTDDGAHYLQMMITIRLSK
jgi:hypothetical protein